MSPHPRGRRRGERVQADRRQSLPQRAELAVLRPEIVPPLADAVRLVDGDVGDVPKLLQEPIAPLARQPLGGDVEQRVAPLAQPGGNCGLRIGAKRTVVARRVDAVLHERVDLILHQGDQRRHDKAETAAAFHQRGRLETQRLAAACRQDDERIAAVEDRGHRFALQRTKRGVAPVFREDVLD